MIPAYQRLRSEPRLGERVREILVNGVSTPKYATVLPKPSSSQLFAECKGSVTSGP
jgi:hypothetical protein